MTHPSAVVAFLRSVVALHEVLTSGDVDAIELVLIEAASPRPAVPGEGVDFTDPDVLSGATPRPAGDLPLRRWTAGKWTEDHDR